MPTNRDIEDALRGLGGQRSDYPPELKTATKAEYLTLARTSKRERKGCPFTVLILLAIPTTIGSLMGVAGYLILQNL